MLKIVSICLLATTCLGDPQRQRYSSPVRDFNEYPGSRSLPGFSSGFFNGPGSFPINGNLQREFQYGGRFGIDPDDAFSSVYGPQRGFTRGPPNFDRGYGIHHGFPRGSGNNYEIGRGLGEYTSGFLKTAGYRGGSAAILRDERVDSGDGSYSFAYETEDGVAREESGAPVGPNGAVVQKGSYSFTFPDGTPGFVRYIADENGFRAESDLIPSAPEHALAQVEKAEQERAAGIFHDGQYRAEDHFGDDLYSSPYQSSLLGGNRGPLSFPRGVSGPTLGGFGSPFSNPYAGSSFVRGSNGVLHSGINGNNRNILHKREGAGLESGPYDDHSLGVASKKVDDYKESDKTTEE